MCKIMCAPPSNITAEYPTSKDEKIITHNTSGGSEGGGGNWRVAEGKKAGEAKVVKG